MKQVKDYSPEQISDAEKLCQLIDSVPGGKWSVFSVVMLAYMNGMEAGMVYAQEQLPVLVFFPEKGVEDFRFPDLRRIQLQDGG